MTYLYNTTHDIHYKNIAISIADYSLNKLYYNGFFRGHPQKNSCASVDGIGFLFRSYAQLESVL